MKISTWMVVLISLFSLLSCVREEDLSPEQPTSTEDPPVVEESNTGIQVKGNASFGSQCPFGTSAFPKPVDITLEDCPIGLSEVELAEPLPPLVLQADCNKKTIDIRGLTPSSYRATNWEFMPDGSFYFKVDGGTAKLKDDGSGNSNCNIPMTAEMWGKIDCTDRDKAIIKVETQWWLGMTPPSTDGSTSSHSGSPRTDGNGAGNSNDPTRSGWHLTPFADSTPSPAETPNPNDPDPIVSPVPIETPVPSPSGSPRVGVPTIPSAPACKVPTSCYFHNLTEIRQCQ